jgi:hypothetical protein
VHQVWINEKDVRILPSLRSSRCLSGPGTNGCTFIKMNTQHKQHCSSSWPMLTSIYAFVTFQGELTAIRGLHCCNIRWTNNDMHNACMDEVMRHAKRCQSRWQLPPCRQLARSGEHGTAMNCYWKCVVWVSAMPVLQIRKLHQHGNRRKPQYVAPVPTTRCTSSILQVS